MVVATSSRFSKRGLVVPICRNGRRFFCESKRCSALLHECGVDDGLCDSNERKSFEQALKESVEELDYSCSSSTDALSATPVFEGNEKRHTHLKTKVTIPYEGGTQKTFSLDLDNDFNNSYCRCGDVSTRALRSLIDGETADRFVKDSYKNCDIDTHKTIEEMLPGEASEKVAVRRCERWANANNRHHRETEEGRKML